MDALVLIVILLLIGMSLLVILYPLWQQSRRDTVLQSQDDDLTLEEYELRYQAILASMKELIFDHEMGKVTDEDYEALLSEAKLRAAQVRQQIDTLSASEPGQLDPALDAEIEDLIAQVRQQRDQSQNGALQQEVEAELELLKDRGPNAVAPARRACPGCGEPLQEQDNFCGRCGQPVPEAVAAAEADVPACPECGYHYEPDDAFCARCGAPLRQDAKTQSYEDAAI